MLADLLTIDFKTKAGEQTYAFSSNPHKMKKYIETGIIEQTDEEKDMIINNLDIEIEYNGSTRSFSSKR